MRLSGYYSLKDVYIGLPCIINRSGYKRIFISLTNKEEEKLRNSIKVLQKAIDSIEGGKDEYI